MTPLNILAVCGSLRQKSTNMGLLRFARQQAPAQMDIQIADLSGIPFYNSDLLEQPQAVKALLQQFKQADAFIFACPEYNYSLAPALKNALDWASRAPENGLLNGKTAAIMGSGGGVGSARAQYHLRQVCVFLNLHLLNKPEVFSNAFSASFDEAGDLIDPDIQALIEQQLQVLSDLTLQLNHDRC